MEIFHDAIQNIALPIIKEARKTMTQAEIGKRLGVKQQLVSYWEQERAFPAMKLPLLTLLTGYELGEIIRLVAGECDRLKREQEAKNALRRPH
jgi:transcriptional regulator with XRE-family HTH domain